MDERQALLAAFGASVRGRRLTAASPGGRSPSQEELAELAGLHRTYIGDVERGTRNVSLVNIARISQALGVPMSVLLKDTEERLAG